MPFPNDLLILCTIVEEVDNPEINSFPCHLSQTFVVKIIKKSVVPAVRSSYLLEMYLLPFGEEGGGKVI